MQSPIERRTLSIWADRADLISTSIGVRQPLLVRPRKDNTSVRLNSQDEPVSDGPYWHGPSLQ